MCIGKDCPFGNDYQNCAFFIENNCVIVRTAQLLESLVSTKAVVKTIKRKKKSDVLMENKAEIAAMLKKGASCRYVGNTFGMSQYSVNIFAHREGIMFNAQVKKKEQGL